MILQTDSRFGIDRVGDFINKYGCLYMCCLFLLNQKKELKLNIAKIRIFFEQLEEAGGFDTDGNLLWVPFFKFFGYNINIKFESATYKLKKNELCIQKYYNEKTGHSHFVVGVGNVVCYDPISNSRTVKEGKCIESRIIKFI